MGYLYVFAAIGFMVLSQLTTKWRIGEIYPQLVPPDGLFAKALYLCGHVVLDPVILFCVFCTFMGGVLWMAAMTKLPISVAYPLTSLGYVLVLLLSCWFFGESFNFYKLGGVACIILGIIIASQG